MLVIVSLLCACVSAAAQLLIPILTGKAIDQMLGAGQVNLSGVLVFAVWIAVVAALSAVAQQFLATSNNKIAYNISRDLRNAAFHKLQRLPLSYLDAHPSGDLVSRMIADVDTFSDGLLMGFTQLFTGVVLIVGTLTIMLIKNWMIALLVVVLTPLSMFVASFIARKTHHYFTEQARVRGQQTALINELIEGQKVVQSFGHEAASLSDFDCINDELGRVSLNATFFSSLTNPSTRLVNNIIYAAVALVVFVADCVAFQLAENAADRQIAGNAPGERVNVGAWEGMAQQAVRDHVQVGARDDLPRTLEVVQGEGGGEERLAPIGHASAAVHLDAVRQARERTVRELDAREQVIAAQCDHAVGERRRLVEQLGRMRVSGHARTPEGRARLRRKKRFAPRA